MIPNQSFLNISKIWYIQFEKFYYKGGFSGLSGQNWESKWIIKKTVKYSGSWSISLIFLTSQQLLE